MTKCTDCSSGLPYVSVDNLLSTCKYFGAEYDIHWCWNEETEYAKRGVTVVGWHKTVINCKECKFYEKIERGGE